jgi:uncharacterized coiled-coil DUF342 family protein
MDTNQSATGSQNIQDLKGQLNTLFDEVDVLRKEINETNQNAEKEMNDLEAKIDGSISSMEQIYSDLDVVEKEAENDLDKLALNQAEDLASA